MYTMLRMRKGNMIIDIVEFKIMGERYLYYNG